HTSARSAFSRTSARRRAALEGCVLESLEQRALLTSDLAVAWDNDHVNIPSTIVPGDRLLAPIFVANTGPTNAIGKLTINFYLSPNATVGSSDTLVRSYADEQIELPVYTGDPAQLGTFTGDLTIPPPAAPGTYFLLVRLLPNSLLGDLNQTNNLAASD